jgi:hypothetical protein
VDFFNAQLIFNFDQSSQPAPKEAIYFSNHLPGRHADLYPRGKSKSASVKYSYIIRTTLKGLSSEIGWAESCIIRKLSFKGRDAGIFNWFRR